jgi:hypothetical protein
MKELIGSLIEHLWIDRWDVFLFIGLILYRKQILVALKGGNGVWQTNELAKGLILIVFYLAFRVESTRTDLSYNVFPESFWFAILGGVALIGGIDIYKYINKKEQPEEKIKQDPEPEITNQ